ncbi:MAG: MgtC/SapB family protein [Candidatus Kaiserbacteria bacterium]|nr:MAG: MgtC/SapB family protein [Candidatus Kaiserbacteria bacterium]
MLESVPFADPTIVVFGKLFLAMLLGGLIGTERAVVARQSAGTRTFGLASLGACLFVVTSSAVDAAYIGLLNFDPLRVAAAVIMGIGFLAGGLIIFRKDSVHGATTAAGLWIATGVGMAVGYGLVAVAVFATLLTLLMFTGMWYVEQRFKHWFVEQSQQPAPPNHTA